MKASQFKSLIAGIATVAVVGVAIAQSTPPNPASANPATGAGQQSSQGTPMGTTGTSGGTGATMGTTMGATTTPSTGSTAAAPADSGTTMASASPRKMRADRN